MNPHSNLQLLDFVSKFLFKNAICPSSGAMTGAYVINRSLTDHLSDFPDCLIALVKQMKSTDIAIDFFVRKGFPDFIDDIRDATVRTGIDNQ